MRPTRSSPVYGGGAEQSEAEGAREPAFLFQMFVLCSSHGYSRPRFAEACAPLAPHPAGLPCNRAPNPPEKGKRGGRMLNFVNFRGRIAAIPPLRRQPIASATGRSSYPSSSATAG